MDLAVLAYKLCKQLPKEEMYGLKSQMTRAAVSVPSNIAEGCSRNSEIEFKRFLEISLGSSFELETQMILAKRLELIDSNEIDEFIMQLNGEQKQINALITTIKRS